VLAKPLEQDEPFDQFLNYVREQELNPDATLRHEVKYAQTRKRVYCLHSEHEPQLRCT
jgi:hypothetical protein